MINHEATCQCVICSSEMTRKELTAKEKQLVDLYGWYAHMVIGDPEIATGFNYHTHGFDQSLGHPDLQIIFPLGGERCHGIAKTIYDQIKNGQEFTEGNETIIPHQDGSQFPVRFIKVREGDRNVLRVILPTPSGELEPKDVAEYNEPEYALQWTVSAV